MTVERAGRAGLMTAALAGLVLACGGSNTGGGSVTPSPEPPTTGAPTKAEVDKAFDICQSMETKENANPAECYKGWLDEMGMHGSQVQVKHATRLSHPSTTHPSNPGPPSPDQDDHPPRPIAIDDSPKPAVGTGGSAGSGFPPQTVSFGECWKSSRLTGAFADDYNNLVTACGKPTGMLPYSKPMSGELSDTNKGDVYTVKLTGGACYRFFAVAGGSIKDIDIGIATMENKIIAHDKYTQPVAVIEWQKPVCVEHDVQFKFIVARDGGGSGGYGFGIWYRPAG
jgi:hypothetical protein